MSACGSDDQTSPESAETTTIASSSSAPPLVPSTSELSTTTATTEIPASTAGTVDASTTTVATERLPHGARGALDFHLDGDPGATPSIFGHAALTEVDESALVDEVSEALGDADADTGWLPMPSAYACTGVSEYRSLLWDDIRYVLARRDANPATTYLSAWTIGDTALAFSPSLAAEITESSGITTDDGIGLGTSADELKNLDWDQSLREDDRFLGLAGIGPVIFQLDSSNQVVAMSYEQNDC